MLKCQVNLGERSERVQYELYIDIFFLINFVLDFFLLLIVKGMLKCSATHGNILMGAGIGAGLTSIIVCLPFGSVWKNIILHTVINMLMLKVTFRIRKNILFKAWMLLYVVGIMMGGVLIFLSQYIGEYYRATSLFLFIVLCSYGIVSKVMEFLELYWRITMRKCKVTLYWNGESCEVTAIKDTGNMLFDPITGKQVHIISANAIKKFTMGKETMVRYIPFHTVQNDSSIMPLIKIDKMCIQGKQEIELLNPLLGISECAYFGNGDYELILHPKGLWEE